MKCFSLFTRWQNCVLSLFWISVLCSWQALCRIGHVCCNLFMPALAVPISSKIICLCCSLSRLHLKSPGPISLLPFIWHASLKVLIYSISNECRKTKKNVCGLVFTTESFLWEPSLLRGGEKPECIKHLFVNKLPFVKGFLYNIKELPLLVQVLWPLVFHILPLIAPGVPWCCKSDYCRCRKNRLTWDSAVFQDHNEIPWCLCLYRFQ